VPLGIVATCRAIGVPAEAYLAGAFDTLGTLREHFGLDLEQMTPATYEAARLTTATVQQHGRGASSSRLGGSVAVRRSSPIEAGGCSSCATCTTAATQPQSPFVRRRIGAPSGTP
jgi:hypothetical protein